MSEFNAGLEFIGFKENIVSDNKEIIKEDVIIQDIPGNPFDISKFAQELESKSAEKNELRAQRAGNITGYDICNNCIREVVYRLTNTPVENYADSWLPILMRSTLGTAIHEFIQNNTSQISEIEVNLKVPSIGFYGKVDGLIGNDTLLEIKSCPYGDYATLIRQQKPRKKDYLQAMCYSYIIENYCKEVQDPSVEIKYGGGKPLLPKYDIKKLQFIYVAHDIIASDQESIGEMLESIKVTKRALNSTKNQFFFMTSLVLDLDDEIKKECYKWIKDKIEAIHFYLSSGNLPKASDPFINHSNCYFCQYSAICTEKKTK